MFQRNKFINICLLCLRFIVLFTNYHLVVVCLGGNYSVKDLGAYCLGCTVWWKKLVDNWLGIFLGVRFGLDLYCWLWEIKMFVWALFGVKKRVIRWSLVIRKQKSDYIDKKICPLALSIEHFWRRDKVPIWSRYNPGHNSYLSYSPLSVLHWSRH